MSGNKRYVAIAFGGAIPVPAGESTEAVRVVRGRAYRLETDHSYFQSAIAGNPVYMRFANGGSSATATDIPFSYEQPIEFVAQADSIFIFNQAAAGRRCYLREEWGNAEE